eukprot:9905186-Lingulodinium_polyedra.AAC.1
MHTSALDVDLCKPPVQLNAPPFWMFNFARTQTKRTAVAMPDGAPTDRDHLCLLRKQPPGSSEPDGNVNGVSIMPTILVARPQTTECRNAGLRRTPLKSFSLVAVINFHQNDVAKLA